MEALNPETDNILQIFRASTTTSVCLTEEHSYLNVYTSHNARLKNPRHAPVAIHGYEGYTPSFQDCQRMISFVIA